jgi:hypothetical protein
MCIEILALQRQLNEQQQKAISGGEKEPVYACAKNGDQYICLPSARFTNGGSYKNAFALPATDGGPDKVFYYSDDSIKTK